LVEDFLWSQWFGLLSVTITNITFSISYPYDILGCGRYVVMIYREIKDSKHLILNTKTKKVRVDESECGSYYDTGGEYVFGIRAYIVGFEDVKYIIDVYNASTLDYISAIVGVDTLFVEYNCKLGLFFDWDHHCFGIFRKPILGSELEFELKMKTLGKNYINDIRIVQNMYMDLVLHVDMIFNMMPLELLCIELYARF